MRTSELLGMPVIDAAGRDLGPLRDLRLDKEAADGRLAVRWLVVGGREWAHRLGYVDGRTRGPWLALFLLRGAQGDQAVAVPASAVTAWGPDSIRLGETAGQVAVPVANVLDHEEGSS